MILGYISIIYIPKIGRPNNTGITLYEKYGFTNMFGESMLIRL